MALRGVNPPLERLIHIFCYFSSLLYSIEKEIVSELHDFEHGGCYQDSKQVSKQRSFPNLAYQDPKKNSVERCQKTCCEKDYLFAAVQYSKQCFCGHSQPSPNFLRYLNVCF